MNNRTLIGCLQRLQRGELATLTFLSPIVSAGVVGLVSER
ncbi:Hypothetical protein CAP_5595 [Chondromyces apiculatus DSM 436]|uniref:Uncharacterized protein n=1 Tax=Chondromyces apiculatus DSM 436 TaxID=1192034 RepID=A0A017T328_9BACT|nr:Hypothetical protein CAP_5595 [Chondromyces apiculatus DSM 436]